MSLIYHIASREALQKARQAAPASPQKAGEYRAESLASEGFIHFSSLHQVLGVADRFYHGQHGLVLLEVEPARANAEVKYEPPVHPAASSEEASSSEQLFPHLYGPLNVDAIVAVYDFEPDVHGRFSLPADLITNTDH